MKKISVWNDNQEIKKKEQNKYKTLPPLQATNK